MRSSCECFIHSGTLAYICKMYFDIIHSRTPDMSAVTAYKTREHLLAALCELGGSGHRVECMLGNFGYISRTYGLFEWWGEWDMCNATMELREDQINSPPPQSVLHLAAGREIVAILREMLTSFKMFHGPTPEARMAAWKSDDAVRTRLARHIANLPNVLMTASVAKGTIFYHGSNNAHIQSQTPEEIAANATSSKNYNVCQLGWSKHASRGFAYKSGGQTAFTTPVARFATAFGRHMYTYKLSVEGSTLRMIDSRTQGFKRTGPLWELAGIKTGFENRNHEAGALYELFRDTGVDGAVMQEGEEWIWFRPGDVLTWLEQSVIDTHHVTR